MTFISIDGDNVGNRLAAAYLENDEYRLTETISHLTSLLSQIHEYLVEREFSIIFCGADGIVCKGHKLDITTFAHYISEVGKPDFTFSAGVGADLQASFIALKYAKATGKNRVVTSAKGSTFEMIQVQSL